jgi:eukaryotic-like serine/threonine-protein kinase
VLDFGLAKAGSEQKVVDSAPASAKCELRVVGGLTIIGQMLGTPDFIAPEQIDDAQGADVRADIYSLGCTLYYLLSGRPPFQAATLYDMLQAHHSMDARLLNFVRLEMPTELAALVAKMMAKEPDRRFQSPSEVAKARPMAAMCYPAGTRF